jgi:hypothetical protein
MTPLTGRPIERFILIRWLVLPALRRDAERRASRGAHTLTHGAIPS